MIQLNNKRALAIILMIMLKENIYGAATITPVAQCYLDLDLRDAIQRDDNTEKVEALLAKKADVNSIDMQCITPLNHAIRRNYLKMVNFLLASKADVNSSGDYVTPPLVEAIRVNNSVIINILLGAKVDINYQDLGKNTALMYAAENGKIEGAQALLLAGSDMDMVDIDEQRAIDIANREEETDSEDVRKNKQKIITLIKEEPSRRAREIKKWQILIAIEIINSQNKLNMDIGLLISDYLTCTYEDIVTLEKINKKN